MIVIKNRFYNNRNKRKRDKIDKKYLKIQSKRLAEEDKKPLNDHEKYLYGEDKFNFECTEIKNGFYKLNKISYIIVPLPKTQIEQFYYASEKILNEHPADTILSTIIDDSTQRSMFNMKTRSNSVNWSNVCVITPQNTCAKFINISVINVSAAYFAACFQVTWDDSIIDEINKLIISKEKYRQKFRQINVNGKKLITKGGNNPDCIRRRRVDDALLECKLNIYSFLQKYYSLPKTKGKMPLSLDEYITNKTIDDRFISSHEYLFFPNDPGFKMHFTKVDSSYVERTCYFELFENSIFDSDYLIRRSRLLIITDNEENNYTSLESMIPLFLVMIKKYSLLDYDNLLMQKQEIVNKSCGFLPKILFLGYRKYLKITKETTGINSILKEENLNYKYFTDVKYTNYDKNIKELFDTYSRRERDMDSIINNIMHLRSNRVALYVAFLSLLVAIIAIIVSIILANGK